MKIFFLIICLIPWLSVPSFGQLSATASTSATIVNSIEFSKEEDMNFKTTIVKSPENKRNSSLRLPVANPNSTIIETRAEFSIGGLANNYVSITVTATPINFNTSGGKVVVRNLKSDFENQITPVPGKQSVKIWGELFLDPTAEAGLYSNSRDMVVVINYN